MVYVPFRQETIGLVILALVVAIGYSFLTKSLSPRLAIVLGIILAFIGKGGVLSLVGTGIAGVGISEMFGQYIEKTNLSSS